MWAVSNHGQIRLMPRLMPSGERERERERQRQRQRDRENMQRTQNTFRGGKDNSGWSGPRADAVRDKNKKEAEEEKKNKKREADRGWENPKRAGGDGDSKWQRRGRPNNPDRLHDHTASLTSADQDKMYIARVNFEAGRAQGAAETTAAVYAGA